MKDIYKNRLNIYRDFNSKISGFKILLKIKENSEKNATIDSKRKIKMR